MLYNIPTKQYTSLDIECTENKVHYGDIMPKLTKENVFAKSNYMYLIKTLNKYPEGLTLHELTYLLTTLDNIRETSKLFNKFNPNYQKDKKTVRRENIFSNRQRIYDSLQHLRKLGFADKDKGVYTANLKSIYLSGLRYRAKIEMDLTIEEMVKENEEDFDGVLSFLLKCNDTDRQVIKKEIKVVMDYFLDGINDPPEEGSIHYYPHHQELRDYLIERRKKLFMGKP